MDNGIRRQRMAVLAAGTVTLLFLGMLYSWSVFVQPLEAEFGWDRAQTTVTYTISLICFSAGMLLEGVIANRKSHRFAAVLGMILVPLGFILCSRTTVMMHLFLFYGVFAGLGIGISYNAWLATIISWFPGRSGSASGILLLGYGLGGMVMGTVASAIINSSLGWRLAFLVIGVAVLLESIAAFFFLKAPPDEIQALTPAPERGGKERRARKKAAYSLNTLTMLRQSAFWSGIVWKCLLYASGLALVGQASPIMRDAGASEAMCTLAVGILSVGNGCGRIIIGALFDRLGNKGTMPIISSAFCALSLVYLFAYRAMLTVPIVIAMFFTGVCYGGIAVMASAFISDTFGNRYFGTNMGTSSALNIPFILVLSTVISSIRANTGYYTGFFYLLLGISAVTLALAIVTTPLIARMDAKYGAAGETEQPASRS